MEREMMCSVCREKFFKGDGFTYKARGSSEDDFVDGELVQNGIFYGEMYICYACENIKNGFHDHYNFDAIPVRMVEKPVGDFGALYPSILKAATKENPLEVSFQDTDGKKYDVKVSSREEFVAAHSDSVEKVNVWLLRDGVNKFADNFCKVLECEEEGELPNPQEFFQHGLKKEQEVWTRWFKEKEKELFLSFYQKFLQEMSTETISKSIGPLMDCGSLNNNIKAELERIYRK